MLFVHDSIADAFLAKFSAAVDALKLGLPWEADTKVCTHTQRHICIALFVWCDLQLISAS